MIKKMSAFIITIVLLLSIGSTVFACDEKQTDMYVTQILFGNSAQSKKADENVKMLMSALYLCSEQCDNSGQDKVDYLKERRVFGIPSLKNLNVKSNDLMQCSHKKWEYEFSPAQKTQANRKKVLLNTVNKVFDFGLVNNWFSSKEGKCNSFAALLYYSHILSDSLAADPTVSQVNINEKRTPSYVGKPYTVINQNQPSFSTDLKKRTKSFIQYSSLDNLGRAGVAFGIVGPDTLKTSDSKEPSSSIRPTGWKQNKYKEIIGSDNDEGVLFERCHLIAHMLGGDEKTANYITGTRYLNKTGMKPIEEEIGKYIKFNNKHVLYRVTPIYKRDNLLATGVQLEAYSIEDEGKGVCYNVFLYNVQPGIYINYTSGENRKSDMTAGDEDVIPFAVYNASENKPDLIFEINKHLEILFDDQKTSMEYAGMMNKIKSIAADARAVGNRGESRAQCYVKMKEYQYKYFEVLKAYVPRLLKKESFFMSAFK